MKRKIFIALAFSVTVLAAFSCKKSTSQPDDDGNTGQRPPNTVHGTVVDERGKPVSGAKVRAVNQVGVGMFVEAMTDDQGKYALQVTNIGGWNIYAWKTVNYKDQIYILRLAMKDNNYGSFATNGATLQKDFVWKLTGDIPDRTPSPANGWGYFGGCLRFVNDNGVLPVMDPGTKVTVTLKPVSGAKYLDGSEATETIVKSFTINSNTTNYYLTDIPVTEYRVSAVSEKGNVKRKVSLGPNDYNNPVEWAEFYFDSAMTAGTMEGGILTPAEFPWYMAEHN